MVDNKGFTLVELIVVVIIISILAAIAVPMVSKSTLKAQGTEAVTLLGHLRTTAKLYFMEHGTMNGFVDADWDSARENSKYYGPEYSYAGSEFGYSTLKVYGRIGTTSEGQWVEMDMDGTIRASYNGDTATIE